MQQLAIDFTSGSKLNKVRLTGQNKRLFDWLASGKTITMHDAASIGVGYLNSRISDLRNKAGVIIYDRFVIKNGVQVKEYSLKQFNS